MHMIIKPRSPDSIYNYYRNHIIVVIHCKYSLCSIGAEVSRGLGRGLWAEASVGRHLRIPNHNCCDVAFLKGGNNQGKVSAVGQM